MTELLELGYEILPHNSQENWIRGGEPGWLYPPQARVIPVLKEKAQQWAVINENGWNGFEEEPYFLDSIHTSEQEAWQRAEEIIS
jgi:hypothetical protein